MQLIKVHQITTHQKQMQSIAVIKIALVDIALQQTMQKGIECTFHNSITGFLEFKAPLDSNSSCMRIFHQSEDCTFGRFGKRFMLFHEGFPFLRRTFTKSHEKFWPHCNALPLSETNMNLALLHLKLYICTMSKLCALRNVRPYNLDNVQIEEHSSGNFECNTV